MAVSTEDYRVSDGQIDQVLDILKVDSQEKRKLLFQNSLVAPLLILPQDRTHCPLIEGTLGI